MMHKIYIKRHFILATFCLKEYDIAYQIQSQKEPDPADRRIIQKETVKGVQALGKEK